LFNFFSTLKEGERYLKTWPKQACLHALFIESKMVYYTRFLIKIFPAFIVLVVSLYLFFPLYFSWANTATFLLFLIGLPTHCLLWLGHRSQQELSPALFQWYVQISEVLNGKRGVGQVMLNNPQFMDLAKLLNRGFKKEGDNFLYKNELI